MGVGPKPCSHMIIGEAPGAEEEVEGVPFVGPSGRLLDQALEEVGRDRSQFYVTNVYKLRPPGNRNPNDDELSAHAELLRTELKEVDPSVVLVLGKVARDHIFPELAGVTLASTRELWYSAFEADTRKWLITYHPSYILRGSFPYDSWVDDIRIFAYA